MNADERLALEMATQLRLIAALWEPYGAACARYRELLLEHDAATRRRQQIMGADNPGATRGTPVTAYRRRGKNSRGRPL